MASDELISIGEAIERGYVFGPIGWNHREQRQIVTSLKMLRVLSPRGRYSVRQLEAIRDDQADPEPAGDIPMVPHETSADRLAKFTNIIARSGMTPEAFAKAYSGPEGDAIAAAKRGKRQG